MQIAREGGLPRTVSQLVPLHAAVQCVMRLRYTAPAAPPRAHSRKALERLRGFPAQQIRGVPNEGVTDYLLASAKGDWEDFMATGMFRKLSAREVARLRDIQFDFE